MNRDEIIAVVSGVVERLKASGVFVRAEDETAAVENAVEAAKGRDADLAAVIHTALLPSIQADRARKLAAVKREKEAAQRKAAIEAMIDAVLAKGARADTDTKVDEVRR